MSPEQPTYSSHPVTGTPSLSEASTTASDGSTISIIGVGAALLRFRRVILWSIAGCVAVSLAVALTRRPTFSSRFAFLPVAAPDASRAGLASLAGQFGISIGGSQSESGEFYEELIRTRDLLAPIVADSFEASSNERIPLPVLLGTDAGAPDEVLENTVKALAEDVITTSVATRTTGIVTIRVATRSRLASPELATRLIEAMSEFNLTKRQSQAKAEREFVLERLQEASAGLRAAEQSLERFLRANRQFQDSPELRFEHDRQQRTVTLRQQVVTALSQQAEEARIREVRDTPLITVLQSPTTPVDPDPRRRVLIVLAGAIFGVFLGTFLAMLLEALSRSSGSSGDLARLKAEWKQLRPSRDSTRAP